jgi:hypothetical protein
MLEIFILFRLCSALGSKLRDKGRNPIGFQLLLVFLWIAAEVTGGIIGFIIGAIATEIDDPAWIFGIGGAVIGVACAAGLVFFIAHSLPSLEPQRVYDREDAYGPGWRRSDRDLLRRYDDGQDRDAPGDAITDRPEELRPGRRDDRIEE